ncbi:hypothetical protein OPIT5_08210 [Opitutaceae bacterium TAV5]|nr:hypothetical protein OPIT5_08210 [Opitutaceae bacterium TAV5]
MKTPVPCDTRRTPFAEARRSLRLAVAVIAAMHLTALLWIVIGWHLAGR